jgi:hypothetical protein
MRFNSLTPSLWAAAPEAPGAAQFLVIHILPLIEAQLHPATVTQTDGTPSTPMQSSVLSQATHAPNNEEQARIPSTELMQPHHSLLRDPK